jgi:hypothetical protein
MGLIRYIHPVVQMGLARRLETEPGTAAALLHLYNSRSPQSTQQIAVGSRSAIGSTRVRIQHIRDIFGSGAVPTIGHKGDTRYRLSDQARTELREILNDMAEEVLAYLAPLIAKAAA